jgi:hypothetical protein
VDKKGKQNEEHVKNKEEAIKDVLALVETDRK